MSEEQKQAVANAKIKLANIWFSGAPDGARGWIGVSLDAVEVLPRTRIRACKTARLMMKTLFNALGAIFWVVCILTLAPVIILAWVLVSLGYGKELEGY